jgi:hypothetical protein
VAIRPAASGVIPVTYPTLTPAAAQAPAANVAAVCTLPADNPPTNVDAVNPVARSWMLFGVRWSYSGTPTAGSLTIAWGSVSETLAITQGGPGFLALSKTFPPGSAVTITLAAGGSGVTGKVYADALLD